MEDIVSLCKRRGLVYQSSEIYNGASGFYDYGPHGVEIKKNIKDAWWNSFVRARSNVVGLDSSIVSGEEVWKASGHVGGFKDPMVDCKESKLRFRADQLFVAEASTDEGVALGEWVCVHEDSDENMQKAGSAQLKKLLKAHGKPSAKAVSPFTFQPLTNLSPTAITESIPSPASNNNTLTEPRDFNLMFQTSIGAVTTQTGYLRPETAQGIFLNYKNVLATTRQKVPFGIAQIGKAFRNEITPRNFVFRSREFEQMEIEYFIDPKSDWKSEHAAWLQDSLAFLDDIGLKKNRVGLDVHPDDDLAHYARACTDITFDFPFGKAELMGIAARGNYDLTQHGDASGKSMEYFDENTKEKYIPHVIEPSLGVDRLFLALVCSAFEEDVVGGEKRSVLKFHPKIAPVKCSVLPLLKNKPEITAAAKKLYEKLRKRWNVEYDESGAVGRRYRRADEIGTPYCITIDFDTIEKDDCVTIRDRDTTEQVRVKTDDVVRWLGERIDGYD
jgi:glycyl-tRNA synthetase